MEDIVEVAESGCLSGLDGILGDEIGEGLSELGDDLPIPLLGDLHCLL